ncbi:bifunctional (p)ppGpp synthetase/guanosine-3',5'-bis(diphosphate) 3'-pyrophosphohydrolase [Leptolyngbya sp. FACHB-261]|uniref:RelA/SpoT family protein n=1 Tax=Leptolyngbya sp. FACHB-261 TaxID=2692806 RepID=UPI001683C8E2|nr:bifunctional (p)ppGpp synthetase/guanosine-3',5'-bis(diphosphate) 3'-pyrophosphohydrolase [Leptolyngbya sp. FACHB-261]MBD2099277.1 bifunctional (p)ppGpp synthetase/guanosine-3',5'-bis(diphosphate) 3'-pyrophosphohydrolase [Leptolyngbya sp. FACHB-261]
MNLTVASLSEQDSELVLSSLDFAVPDWLQSCWIQNQRANDPSSDTALICRAFDFAYRLHEGQYRKSGEPYIAHPVAVAGMLRDLGGSSAMIAAGFLHDVVEDTEITAEQLEQHFGAEVRCLVEGVTKLSKFNFESKTESQAENFRRMFLAMAQDIRVIVVKLADRLHNMRTLEHLPDAKRRRIARETREIFAPLANRLGIWRFKWELEDLAFKYLEPEDYRRMQELVSEKRTEREAHIDRAVELLRERLLGTGLRDADITGRPKHLYGIFQKMQRQNKEYHEIYDVAAVRVIINGDNGDCYRALAVVHDCFRPIPGRFKDYIGLPKPNRYQSLHTAVIGLSGRPLEVQIRTREMHHVAEYGIAAHWKYKESGTSNAVKPEDEKFTWLRQLVEWQSDLKDAQEYLDSIRENLFDSEVYVFTPKGDVIALAQGSTPVDFAYRIHTEVGNRCCGARVNERMMPLDTRLKNGDIVDILNNKNAHPSLDWINFVATASARNRIRQWFKRSRREENLARGREFLEREIGKKGFESLLKSDQMRLVAERCNYHSSEDLLAGLGYGEVTITAVVNKLRENVKSQVSPDPTARLSDSAAALLSIRPTPTAPASTGGNRKSPIIGVEGLLYHLAGCCKPVPGEAIIGVVTRSARGISIHRQGCTNADSIPGDRLVPVSWNRMEDTGRAPTYPIDIQVEVIDRVGVLKDILTRLADSNINVRNAEVKTNPGETAFINMCIEVTDREQLQRTLDRIDRMSDTILIRRLSHDES